MRTQHFPTLSALLDFSTARPHTSTPLAHKGRAGFARAYRRPNTAPIDVARLFFRPHA
ncbi:MAG: hypothetical protein Q4A31_12345 [Corynebacterium sp.]|uniref:hypothetical protein n=1 Tax=Corynebacterium sp. TaxID=1720 RepID=UPI0026DC85E2|nr:hypothetical protein [Corynebacterium sp.]MDO4762702.1 hypothetical protein [Corynebacterium sp.]